MASTKRSIFLLFSTLVGAFALTHSVTAQSIVPESGNTNTIVTPDGNRLDITGGQRSGDGANLFHGFKEFNVNSGQIANFISSPEILNILSRINGGNPSYINGLIQVTGGNSNLFLMNPSGIVFGANASLNVPAAFTATTANGIGFGNNWFNAVGTNNYANLIGKPNAFAFTSSQPAAIVNFGDLAVGAGQDLSVLAGSIENSGKLSAPGGNLTIAAIPGENLVRISQTGFVLSLEVATTNNSPSGIANSPSLNSNPDNLPQLLTGGNLGSATQVVKNPDGTITLTGSSGQIYNQGQLSASSSDKGGQINVMGRLGYNLGQIVADGDKGGNIQIAINNLLDAGTLSAEGTSGEGGNIAVNYSGRVIQTTSAATTVNGQIQGGTIEFNGGADTVFTSSGNLSATGERGGTVRIFGENVRLLAGNIDASGKNGGGEILVGGDFQGRTQGASNAQNTLINHASNIRADAQTEGNGGRVIVWSDKQTTFAGNVTAQGGRVSGNGGFVEVSGKENLTMSGTVNVGALNGLAGTLLLDPKNIVIDDTTGGFPSFDLVDPNPGGSGAEMQIVPLSTGNVVVAKPGDNFGGSNAGAVYLYNGFTGALISTLTGSTANDQGDAVIGGVTALTNGNYVVSSPNWVNGATTDAGAVTWGNGSTGITGAVSAANSLVGTTTGDRVGFGVTALTNGNYVVSSSLWDNGATIDAGAVTWGNGSTGITGPVSAANSLVGTTTNDNVGYNGVTALTNGNYVVRSTNWNNGAAANAGAVTWGNGSTGITGPVTAANSLVGTTTGDSVGNFGVTALTNGNYVVSSTNWDNGAVTSAGAVTWGNGSTGITGAVSAANSLVGTTTGDFVGNGGVTALTNGNYVVSSYFWNNGATANAGAVTWGNGSTGITGAVSAANSLVGTTTGDTVGRDEVTALTNGNYVVRSYFWNNGAATRAGAVTWGNGSTGITGPVTAANSLVGTTTGDLVGNGGVTALTNGNYVVRSDNWNNGATTDAGAVTWGNGSTGITGAVSAANSLVGTTTGDQVGYAGGVTALTNGNYVVSSYIWNNGAATSAGAVTWGNGSTGITGAVSAANSLVGTTTNDFVGFGGVTALTNGNYVVRSSLWDNGATTDAGAVTWGNGSAGITGAVSAANSLVGTTTNDRVGIGVTALTNGNYVVRSDNWDNGAVTDAGAATWVNGSTGQTLDGINIVSRENSIIGQTANAGLGIRIPVEDNVNNTFLVPFSAGTGRVAVGFDNPTPSLLTFNRGQNSTITLTTNFLHQTLDTGTAVVLQANNDITLNSPITTNNPTGNGGDLTFQAGRSIILNTGAGITTDNGNLTLTANETLANGVVDAERSAGQAVITIAPGVTIDSGTGDTTITLSTGAGLTNNTSGDITIGGNILAANLTINNNGPNNGAVNLSSTANLNWTGNLNVTTTGGDIQIDIPLVLSNDAFFATGTTAGNITFNQTIDGTTSGVEALNLTAGGDITINGAVGSTTRIGDLNITNANNVTTGAITAASITQTAGSGTTTFQGDLNTNSATGINLTGNTFKLNGNIATTNSGGFTINNTSLLEISANTSFNLDGAFNQTGNGAVSLAANITTTDDDINFTAPVTLTGNVTFTPGTAKISFGSTLAAGNNPLTLRAGEIDFNGAVTGSNTIVLEPATAEQDITIGDSTNTAALDLNAVELANIQDGFSLITIGRPDGNGTITLNGNSTFNNPTKIQSPTGVGSITGTGNITGSVDASITLLANQNITTGNITAPAGITITSNNGSIDTSAGTLDSSSTTGDGRAITISAAGDITTANIFANSDGVAGNGGNITLSSETGTINTSFGRVESRVTNNATGDSGTVTLTSQDDIRTGSIITWVGKGSTGTAGSIFLTSNQGNIDSSAGNLDAGTTFGKGGEIVLKAQGNITTGGLFSYVVNSGIGDGANISLTSTQGNIITNGDVYSFTDRGNGGAITFNAGGNITTTNIKSSSLSNGSGGTINLTSDNGAIDVSAGTLDSSSTTGNGGAITLSSPTSITASNIKASGTPSGGSIELTSNLINLVGGTDSISSQKGTLTLQPFTSSQNLEIAPTNLAPFQDGFTSITFGKSDGSGIITIPNPVTFNDPTTIRSPQGSIALNGQITGTDNASITLNATTIDLKAGIATANQNIAINGNAVLGNDVTISTGTDAGDISFSGTVEGNQLLTADAGSGNVTFKNAIGKTNPLSGLNINGQNVNINSSTEVAGNIDINSTGNLNLNNTVTTTNNGSITLTNTKDLILKADNFSLDGAFTQDGTGSVSISGNLTTTDDDIKFSAPVTLIGNTTFNPGTATISFGSTLAAGNYPLNLRAGEIELNGLVSGTNTLELQPVTAGQNIALGSSTNSTDLDLTAQEIANLQDGFKSITIGKADGSGIITIANTITFNDPTTIRSPQGSIALNRDITGTNDASITLNATTIDLKAGITTANQNIAVNGNAILGNDVTISTGTGAGDISFSGTVNGKQLLSADAGSGNVTFEGAIGNTNPLSGLTINGQNVDINSTTEVAGNIDINSTGTLNLNNSVTTRNNGSVTLTNTKDLTLKAENFILDGAFTQDGTGSVSISGNLSTTNDDIKFSSTVTLTGNTTFDPGTAKISFGNLIAGNYPLNLKAGEIDLNGLVSGTNTLELEPATAGQNIALGSSTNSTDLDLTATEIANLQDGFKSITIGRTDGSGQITLSNNLRFNDPVTIQSPVGTGAIAFNAGSAIVGTGDASVTLLANQDITTNNITAPAGITVTSNSGNIDTSAGTLDSSSTTSNGGPISLFAAGDITAGNLSASSNGKITLNSDTDANDAGAIDITNATITSGGGAIVLGGGKDPSSNPAVGTAANPDGVRIDNSTLNSGSGNISIRGKGLSDNSTKGHNGIILQNASTIESTGTGTITLNGTGGIGTNGNTGISIDAATVRSEDGTINISGIGGNGTEDTNRGINLQAKALVESTGIGALVFNGTGGTGTDNNMGIVMFNSEVQANSGNISFTGIGGSGSSGNDGILLSSGSQVSTQNGNISFSGTATGDQEGIQLLDSFIISSGNEIAIISNSGNIDTSTGTVDSSSTTGNGGAITLKADRNITTGNVNSSSQNNGTGGNINLTSNNGTINTSAGNLDSSSVSGIGGPIALSSPTSITASKINASGTPSGGNIELTSNIINLLGGTDSISSKNGTLTLQPFTSSQNLEIAPTNLAPFQDGFTSITFGKSDGSGIITIPNPITFNDPTTIRSPQGSIAVNAQITGKDNASITLNAATINLNSGITTAQRNIAVNGNTILGSNVILSTGTGDGDINFKGTVDGTQKLQLDAGTGNIRFNAAVGNTQPLSKLDITSAGNVFVSSGITTNNSPLTFNVPVTLTENAVFNTRNGNINFANTLDSEAGESNDLTLRAGSGNVNFNGAVGGGTNQQLGAILIESAANLAATSNINAGSLRYSGGTGTISLQGDVTTTIDGVNLSTGGNISTANITSNGSNINLTSNNGTVTTANLDASSTAGNGSPIALSAPDNITTGNLTSSSTTAAGGNLTINSQNGIVNAGNLNASGKSKGGDITVKAQVQITAGQINSSAVTGNGGNVILDPDNDIEVEYINAQGGSSGTGGQVDVTTGNFFRATGSFTDRNGLASSISTAGGTGGGAITISHAGGDKGDPIEPFAIGDASTNGTAGAITSGTSTLGVGNNFPRSDKQGNIQLVTDDGVDPSPPGPTDPLTRQEPSQRSTQDDRSLTPQENPANRSTLPNTRELDESIAALEEVFTREYEAFLGQPPTTPIQSIQQIQKRLREIQRETSIKPALLYIVFGRQNMGENAALMCPMSETEENRDVRQQLLCDRSPDDTVELIVVTGNNEPIRLQIPEATRKKVEALVKEMREEITKTTRDIQPDDYRKSSQALYQLIIEPIEPVLKQQGITNLIVVPDVTIRSLPIAALHDGQQFLIEKYSLAIMPSFSLTKPRYVNISNTPILAMGASTFPQSADQKPLPAVSIELATITANTNQSQLFLNQDFTLDNLKTKHSTGNFGIVHLATHAAFEPNDRKNSYIQLWDIKLQLPQMKQLEWNNPQIELLVLSACQTAIGNRQAELGFAGLALQAGVKSAVASLWSSNDIGTLALMTEFYHQLKQGKTRAEALRQAQIAILTGRVSIENGNLRLSNGTSVPLPEIEKNDRKFDHPYYWSAFTVIGNPW